jgi:hypothetical protein
MKPSHSYLFRNDGTTRTRYDLEKWDGPTQYPVFHTVGKRSKTGRPSVSLSAPHGVQAVFGRKPSWCLEAPPPVGYVSGIFIPDIERMASKGYGAVRGTTGTDIDAILVYHNRRCLTVWIFPGMAAEVTQLFMLWSDVKLEGMESLSLLESKP